MQQNITVTETDYDRLMGLMEFASLKAKMPDIATRLYGHLSSAHTLPPANIDRRIVTMNSRLKLRNLENRRETEITLTYPRDAQPLHRKVSVFSEIGAALLGRREREVVSWKVPGGVGHFEIVKVTYQPEAAGDFEY